MSAPAVPGSSSKREKRAFSWRKIAQRWSSFQSIRRHLGQRDPTLKSCRNRGHRKLARGVQRQTWRRGNLQKNEGRA